MNHFSKYHFLSICVLVTGIFFSGCQPSGNLTEQELYNIINEIIADDSLHVDVVCWKFKDIQLKADYKSVFNADDIVFINQQKALFENKTIMPNALHWSPRRSAQ